MSFILCLSISSLWAYGYQYYRNAYVEKSHFSMCSPKVERETIEGTLRSVGALLDSDIFAEQNRLRQTFAEMAQISDRGEMTKAFLGLIGVTFSSEEQMIEAYAQFIGVRSYDSYLAALEKNMGVTLSAQQRSELIKIFDGLRGSLD